MNRSNKSSQRLRGSAFWPDEREEREALFGFTRLVNVLGKILFSDGMLPVQGLLAIAGSTKCGKSNITRGLIAHYLANVYRKEESPHLLTYEDPIECPLFPLRHRRAEFDFSRRLQDKVRYTPREKGKDVAGLKPAIRDALRQTPTVFYIGEVRDGGEWREILEFAGTGHFVVATTHAGSLAELLGRLLHEAGAVSPAERGYYASRIFGLVHLATVPSETSDHKARNSARVNCKIRGIIPAVWRRTGDALPRLVNDYLASLLPRFYGASTFNLKVPMTDVYMLGRAYFLQRLIRVCVAPSSRSKVSRLLLPEAIRADLKGE